MTIVFTPIRYHALPEITSGALRWLVDFDPFGPYDSRTHDR